MRTIILLIIAALITGACATSAGATEDGTRTIELNLSEFKFAPQRVTLTAGERVTLRLVNRGAVEHEFMAGREVDEAEGGYHEDLFHDLKPVVSGAAMAMEPIGHEHEGFGVRVAPGRTAEITFVVPDEPGVYEIGCFVPGHYEAGMKATLVIER